MQPELELIKITNKLQEKCGCFDCEDVYKRQEYNYPYEGPLPWSDCASSSESYWIK